MSGHPAPETLSRELRRGTGPFLDDRRAVTALTLVSIAAMGVISLYQMGVLKHLPEPPVPGLDADKVNGSPEAYEMLATPDAVLGLGSYAATLALAAAGGADRHRTQPWIPLALAAKALGDAAAAAKLLVDQPTRYGAFCSFCCASAAATFAVVPRVWPEARAAWQQITGK